MRLGTILGSALALAAAANAQTNSTLVNEILTALEEATTCAACHSGLLPTAKLLADLGDGPFSDTFTVVCQTIGVRLAALTGSADLLSTSAACAYASS
jgi:hypothetical protein